MTRHNSFLPVRWLWVLLLCSFAISAVAAERPLVTIKKLSGEEIAITRDQVAQLPIYTVNSSEPGREGAFRGPLLRDVLALVGVNAQTIEISAYDSYYVQIERAYWADYDSILATEREGVTMKIRDKGSLWLIFPWDKHTELRNERFYNLSIWQIKEIKELP